MREQVRAFHEAMEREVVIVAESEGESAIGALSSLGLCLAAAFVLALLRRYEKKISQEALIGVTYAFASGALILVADRLPHGAEHPRRHDLGSLRLFGATVVRGRTFFFVNVENFRQRLNLSNLAIVPSASLAWPPVR